MRASRSVRGKTPPGKTGTIQQQHISGAEGLFDDASLGAVCRDYLARALEHPRGAPDTIVLTLERTVHEPALASLLPLSTIPCRSPEEAAPLVRSRLLELGVSKRAIGAALGVVHSLKTMRGAALIAADSGKRLEPDLERGVRVSRIGLEPGTARRLRRLLSRRGINTETVREALTLASKVASCPDVVAELCVSDDPDYTTGYLASRTLGYLRIPNIKPPRSMSGGRVFLLRAGADIGRLVSYLETMPVLVTD